MTELRNVAKIRVADDPGSNADSPGTEVGTGPMTRSWVWWSAACVAVMVGVAVLLAHTMSV